MKRQSPISELRALRRRVAELEKSHTDQSRENELLKSTQEQLRVLLDHTYDIVFQLSPSGIIQYISPRVKEVYGYEPEDLIGEHFSRTTPAVELPKALEVLETVLSGKEVTNFQIDQVNVNGKILATEINVTPVKQGGKITAVEGVMRDITQRKRMEEEAERGTEKLLNALEKTISAIAMIIEMRDPYTAGHQRRVTKLACAIAKDIDLPEDHITGLRLAGLIHDIGKVRVPAEILTHPDGLTEAEFTMIKMHPLLGYEILAKMDLPWPIAKIVYQHHERMDGSGYPLGLSGEEIILEARILAVADVVEAMSSHRPYRPALGLDKALNEITEKRDILYDPKVVDACLRLSREQGFKFE